MGKKNPEHIGKTLEKIWKKMQRSREERTEISQTLENLDLFLGKRISSNIRPYKIYRKKLIILVDTPAYLQELLFKKEGIINAVNRSFGKEVIKDVNFRVG